MKWVERFNQLSIEFDIPTVPSLVSSVRRRFSRTRKWPRSKGSETIPEYDDLFYIFFIGSLIHFQIQYDMCTTHHWTSQRELCIVKSTFVPRRFWWSLVHSYNLECSLLTTNHKLTEYHWTGDNDGNTPDNDNDDAHSLYILRLTRILNWLRDCSISGKTIIE